MDTTEAINQIRAVVEPISTVPSEFWYASTMLLTAVLIWIIQKYFSSLQTTIKELAESIKDLTKLVILHDEQIKQIQGRLPKKRA